MYIGTYFSNKFMYNSKQQTYMVVKIGKEEDIFATKTFFVSSNMWGVNI